jgi:hypothetical protein
MTRKLCGYFPDCYLKALIDVLDLFEMHSVSLKHFRLYSHKHVHALLAACIDGRDTLRKWGGYADIIRVQDGKAPKYMLKEPK